LEKPRESLSTKLKKEGYAAMKRLAAGPAPDQQEQGIAISF
jgi:hypothetical protein